jgi:hypothetical protein
VLAREDETGKKRGRDNDGASFIGDATGVGDGPRAASHGGEAWGWAWGQCGVAGSGTRPALKQGRTEADRWAPTIVPGSGGLNTFQIQTNLNYFKTFQILTDPKIPFPSLKILK